MKRKKNSRPRFEGESFLGKWELTVNPDAGTYVVKSGGSPLVFPNFDNWSEAHGKATTRRQMEVERDHFGTVLFRTRDHAIAAAMELSRPDGHKTGGFCECTQCLHYKKEALAKKHLKDQPEIEI